MPSAAMGATKEELYRSRPTGSKRSLQAHHIVGRSSLSGALMGQLVEIRGH